MDAGSGREGGRRVSAARRASAPRHLLVVSTLRRDAWVAQAARLQLAGCALACSAHEAAPPSSDAPLFPALRCAWAFAGEPALARESSGQSGGAAWLSSRTAAAALLAQPAQQQQQPSGAARAARLARRVSALAAEAAVGSGSLLDVLWLTDDPAAASPASLAVAHALLGAAQAAGERLCVRLCVVAVGDGALAASRSLALALGAAQPPQLPARPALPLLLDAGVVWRGAALLRGLPGPPAASAPAHAHPPPAARLRGKAALAAPLPEDLQASAVPAAGRHDAACPRLCLSLVEDPAARAAFGHARAAAWARCLLAAQHQGGAPAAEAQAGRPARVQALLVARAASLPALLPCALASTQPPMALTQGGDAPGTATLLRALAASPVALSCRPLLACPPDHAQQQQQQSTASPAVPDLVLWHAAGAGCWAAVAPPSARAAPLFACCEGALPPPEDPAAPVPPAIAALAALPRLRAAPDDVPEDAPGVTEAHEDDEALRAALSYVRAKWEAVHCRSDDGDGAADGAGAALEGLAPAPAAAAPEGAAASLGQLAASCRERLLQAVRPPHAQRAAARQQRAAAAGAGRRGGGARAGTPPAAVRPPAAVQHSVGRPRVAPSTAAGPAGRGAKRSADAAGLALNAAAAPAPRARSRGAAVAAAAVAAASEGARAAPAAAVGSSPLGRSARTQRTLAFEEDPPAVTLAHPGPPPTTLTCPAPACGLAVPTLLSGRPAKFCPHCGTRIESV